MRARAAHLATVDFELNDPTHDVLGDAYEYLIAQFASGAGKKAGVHPAGGEHRAGAHRHHRQEAVEERVRPHLRQRLLLLRVKRKCWTWAPSTGRR